jgi:L-asparagine oxygenase
VRPDPEHRAQTTLVHARDVVAHLNDGIIDMLRLPLYHAPPPLSFGGRGVGTGPFPVLQGSGAHAQLNVDLSETTGLTFGANQALLLLRQACMDVAVEVELDVGDLLLIGNRRVLHGRTSFEPRLDVTDRWLLRTMIRSGDLWDWRVYVEDHCLVF